MRCGACPAATHWSSLGFTGATVDSPLISEVSRRFNIDISILSADIEYAGGVKFGFLLAELCSGTRLSARRPSSSSSTNHISAGGNGLCPEAMTNLLRPILGDSSHPIQLEVMTHVRSND